MLFNSIEFAFFLPIVFILYWFAFRKNLKLQNLFVVAASYLFYGWWDWRFLLLIAFTSFCSWGSGLLIKRYASTPKAKLINILNIVINLGILCTFKYYDFFISSFAALFPSIDADRLLLKVILPVGVSFYTFQALGYSIDVYKGRIEPVRDIVQFFAFVSFFPQLVAGPIERASNLLPQFGKKRAFDYSLAADGVMQSLWGLFKKMVVADNCALYVDQVFASYQTAAGSSLLLAAILFAFQIYGDFSGYSDIAIGVSKMFGIKLKRNFNTPYFSRDIAEFWRRWHISLNTWFRDYVYIPLGGSRCSAIKVVRNTFIIFLLSGLWHGANWTFVAWGGFHALLFLPLIITKKNRKYQDTVAAGRLIPSFKELLQMCLTFLLVVAGWILFRSESISDAFSYFAGMAHIGTLKAPLYFFTNTTCWWMVVVMLLVEWFSRTSEHGLSFVVGASVPRFWKVILCVVLADIILLFKTGSQSFIYFQF